MERPKLPRGFQKDLQTDNHVNYQMSIALHKHKCDHTMKLMAHSRPELYEILPEKDALKSSPVKVTPEMDKEFYKTLPSYADMQKLKKDDAFGTSVLKASRDRLEKRRDALKSSPVKVTPEMDKEFYETLPSYADMQKWKKEDVFGKSALLQASRQRLEKGRDALKSSPVKVTPEMVKEFYETLPSYADMQKWKKEDVFGKSALLQASRRRLEKSADMQNLKKEHAFGKSALEGSRDRLEKRRDALKSAPARVTSEMDKEFYKTSPSYAERQKWKIEVVFGETEYKAGCRRLGKIFGGRDSHLPAAREAKESKAEREQQSRIKTFKLRTPSPLAVVSSLRASLLAKLQGSMQYKSRGDQIIVGGKYHGQPRPKFHGRPRPKFDERPRPKLHR